MERGPRQRRRQTRAAPCPRCRRRRPSNNNPQRLAGRGGAASRGRLPRRRHERRRARQPQRLELPQVRDVAGAVVVAGHQHPAGGAPLQVPAAGEARDKSEDRGAPAPGVAPPQQARTHAGHSLHALAPVVEHVIQLAIAGVAALRRVVLPHHGQLVVLLHQVVAEAPHRHCAGHTQQQRRSERCRRQTSRRRRGAADAGSRGRKRRKLGLNMALPNAIWMRSLGKPRKIRGKRARKG